MEHSRQNTLSQDGVFQSLAEMRREMEEHGRNVIDLSIGSPDLEPPERVRRAISSALLAPGCFRYSLGDSPELRSALSRWYSSRYAVAIDPTTEAFSMFGSQDGLTHVFLAYTDPGDLVLLPDPCFPAARMGAALAGVQPVYTPLYEKNGFLPDLGGISPDVARAARMILVSYPNNPTGALAPDSFYDELIAFALEYGLIIINDNAYSDIIFDDAPGKSIFAFKGAKKCAIELFSLSKSFSIPGVRMAFCVGDNALIDPFRRLSTQLSLGSFLPLQYGAAAALEARPEELAELCEIYRKRRDAVERILHNSRLRLVPCRGSLFLWAALPENMDDRVFVKSLLEEKAVLLAPGSAFGSVGRGHVRLSLMQPEETLETAALRISESRLLP